MNVRVFCKICESNLQQLKQINHRMYLPHWRAQNPTGTHEQPTGKPRGQWHWANYPPTTKYSLHHPQLLLSQWAPEFLPAGQCPAPCYCRWAVLSWALELLSSTKACELWPKPCWEPPPAHVQKSPCESQGPAQPCGKPSPEQGELWLLWAPAPGEGLQLGCEQMAGSTSLGSVSQECCTDASAAPQSISFLVVLLRVWPAPKPPCWPAGPPCSSQPAGVPSRDFLGWGQPCGAQGTGQELSALALGVSDGSVALSSLQSLAGGRMEQLCRKTQHEAPQGFGRRARTGWEQSWWGGRGPAPAAPEGYSMCCWVFLWDLSWAQADVPAPVGWCGSLCLLLELPEKLLIQHAWWACCFDLSLLGISSRAFNKSPIKEAQVGALCFFNT